METTANRNAVERSKLTIAKMRTEFRDKPDATARLSYLCKEGRLIIEQNPADFLELSELVLAEIDDINDRSLLGALFMRRGSAYTRLAANDEARKELNKAKEIAEEIGDTSLLMYTLKELATLLVYAGHVSEGMRFLKQTEELAAAAENYGVLIHVCFIASLGYISQSRYFSAIRECERSLEYSTKDGMKRSAESIHHNLGIAYAGLEHFDEALRNFNLSLNIARSINYPINIANALLCIARTKVMMKDVDESVFNMLREAKALTEMLQSNILKEGAAAVWAMACFERSEFDMSRAYALKALEIAKKVKLPRNECSACILLARLDLLAANLNGAQQYAERSLEIASEQHFNGEKAQALEILKDVRSAAGEFEEALKLLEQHTALTKTINDEKIELMYSDLTRTVEIEQSRQEVTIAMTKSALQQQEALQVERERDQTRNQLVAKTIQISAKNELLQEAAKAMKTALANRDPQHRTGLRTTYRNISIHLDEDNLWNEFEEQFSLLHPDFMERLQTRHPDLSSQERKICALMKLEIPSKDVCRIMRLSQRSVESHRYRIRKKIGLDSKLDLQPFLRELA